MSMCNLYKPRLKDAEYEIPFYLDYWFMRRRALNVFPYISLCKMKRPLVGPFLADFIFMESLYKPCPKDAVCHDIRVFGMPVREKKIFKIHQILRLLAPYWAPIGVSPLVFATLNAHSLNILSTKFGWNQCSGFGEVI